MEQEELNETEVMRTEGGEEYREAQLVILFTNTLKSHMKNY